MRKLKVIIKRPDSLPYSTWVSDSLENLQRLVDGYIEVVTICPQTLNDRGECVVPGMAVICDEEGLIHHRDYNCKVDGIEFVGDIVFVGIRGDEFDDIPVSFREFKMMFPELWEV